MMDPPMRRRQFERAAELAPGAQATFLTVWEPFYQALADQGSFVAGSYVFTDPKKIDEISRDAAHATAIEGARQATAAGLVAEPRAVSCDGDVSSTILAAAADVDADVIVIGTRGLSRVKAFLLGGVSHAVVQHADRAVLLGPLA
jgi:nucleotide-binding universal stress UspA family protein